MQIPAAGQEVSAPGATKQRAAGEDERMAEMEKMFCNLVRNVEKLNGENAVLGRRLGVLEITGAIGQEVAL